MCEAIVKIINAPVVEVVQLSSRLFYIIIFFRVTYHFASCKAAFQQNFNYYFLDVCRFFNLSNEFAKVYMLCRLRITFKFYE